MNDFLDLRIIKTRNLLIRAWFNLLEQKKSQTNIIKITEICKKADVALLTFYHHFNSKQAFFKFALEEQLINKLPIPKNLKPSTFKQLAFKVFEVLFDFVFENINIFRNTFEFHKHKGNEYTFVNIFIEVVTCRVFDEVNLLKININRYEKEILTLLLVGAALHCLFRMVKQNKIVDKNNFVNHLNVLYKNIVNE